MTRPAPKVTLSYGTNRAAIAATWRALQRQHQAKRQTA